MNQIQHQFGKSMTAVVNNLEAKLALTTALNHTFHSWIKSYDFDEISSKTICYMCLPTLKRSFFNIKLQEKDGDMQSCHQIDEEELLDIDESVTILELRWEPNRLD